MNGADPHGEPVRLGPDGTGSAPGHELAPRRYPTQQRSRDRFDRILAATRALLLDAGIEALSCEAIAVQAGVPVGTVYQFFPNKFAIVCELDRLDTGSVMAALDEFAQQIPTLDWPDELDALIGHLAHAWKVDPSRRAVWLSMQATSATRAAALSHQHLLGSRVARIIAPLTPNTHRRERDTVGSVVVHLCYSMLNFSVRDGHAHPTAVRELKRVLRAYLSQVAADDGGA
jgi:AcrR family transcriptional regulator